MPPGFVEQLVIGSAQPFCEQNPVDGSVAPGGVIVMHKFAPTQSPGNRQCEYMPSCGCMPVPVPSSADEDPSRGPPPEDSDGAGVPVLASPLAAEPVPPDDASPEDPPSSGPAVVETLVAAVAGPGVPNESSASLDTEQPTAASTASERILRARAPGSARCRASAMWCVPRQAVGRSAGRLCSVAPLASLAGAEALTSRR